MTALSAWVAYPPMIAGALVVAGAAAWWLAKSAAPMPAPTVRDEPTYTTTTTYYSNVADRAFGPEPEGKKQ